MFRCQLPRENKYYKPTPPNEDDPQVNFDWLQSIFVFQTVHIINILTLIQDEVLSSVKLCQVCGCRGSLSCSKCKSVNYCGKEHQVVDWTLGKHKTTCGSKEKLKIGNEEHKYLLDEFDLVTEAEDEVADSQNADDSGDDEARRLKDYEEFVEKQKQNAENDLLADVPDEEFDKYTGQIDDDKVFRKFKKRIAAEPEQVIRFDRGGSPLWITNQNQPTDEDIPACEICKTPRIFEFQVKYSSCF